MTSAKLPHLTRCGLPGIDVVPFGLHACHFYRDRDELVATLAPFFAAGLRANERCLWITAPPLPAAEAVQVLAAAHDGVEAAVASGALRVIDHADWYAQSSRLRGPEVVQLWLDEEERALAEGFSGLRVTGNMSFLTSADWAGFLEYEQAVNTGFNGRRIVALCSYDLAQCDDAQIEDVIQAHHCAFERPGETWQVAVAKLPKVS